MDTTNSVFNPPPNSANNGSPSSPSNLKRNLGIAGAAVLGLATIGFGPRAYRSIAVEGVFDPEVKLPTLVDVSKIEKGPSNTILLQRRGAAVTDQELIPITPENSVSDVDCVFLNPNTLVNQLSLLYATPHRLKVSLSDISCTSDGRIALYYLSDHNDTERFYRKDGTYYEVPASQVKYNVYQGTPQSFPSQHAYNDGLASDWFDQLLGLGNCRCSPHHDSDKTLLVFMRSLPQDEIVIDWFPNRVNHATWFPDSQWVFVTRVTPPDPSSKPLDSK